MLTRHLINTLHFLKKLSLLAILIFLAQPIKAGICTAAMSGLWSNSSTWSCVGTPVAGDVIRIRTGAIVTIPVGTIIDLSVGPATTILVEAGGQIQFQAGAMLKLSSGSTITLDPMFVILPAGVITFGNAAASIEIGGNVIASGAMGASFSGPATWDETTILPIELAYFTAAPSQNGIRLSWQTLREVNNSHFTVERSVDGSIFETLTTLSGAGNSDVPLTYEFTDNNNARRLAYYRLKQTDFDGATTYSHIISIENNGLRQLKSSLFPNPATDVATISLVGGIIDPVEVLITDSMGRVLYRQTTPAT